MDMAPEIKNRRHSRESGNPGVSDGTVALAPRLRAGDEAVSVSGPEERKQ